MLAVTLIITIAKCLGSVFDFLCTIEGQMFCQRWREGDEKLRADVETLWKKLTDEKFRVDIAGVWKKLTAER
jgi:hypothetical protein